MTYTDIFLIGIGLSMDAFAVAVCKSLAIGRFDIKKAFVIALWFGAFQGIMPALGYLLGSVVSGIISRYSGIVAFILLTIIGAGMIREAMKKEDGDESCEADVSFSVMFAAAVATSIDALSVGVTFSAYDMNIVTSALLIAATTFCISLFAVRIGTVFGARYKDRAELLGGIILILIGLKLLLGI